jgi:hypothetical protein
MKTDIEIQKTGYDALMATLSPLEFERFLVMIKREKFDYTQWRGDQFKNMTVDEIAHAAESYNTENYPEG